MYPAGVRCKSLCQKVLTAGFIKEEVSHVCVVVEEPPPGSVELGYDSAAAYNLRKTETDEWLSSCFLVPWNDVRHAMLAHSHIALVVRAFITQAQWNLQPIETKGKPIITCDANGKLSLGKP